MRLPAVSRLPSASKLQLALTCPASWVLPQVSFASPTGEEGTELHSVLDVALEARRSGVGGEVLTAERQRWLDGALEAVGDRLDAATSEMALGYDPADGAVSYYGERIGRAYPETRGSGVVAGSIDYVAPRQGGGWLVVDLKTGLGEETPVARNWQLRWAALAVSARQGGPVQTAILHAPRDASRPWWEYGPTYDALDLVSLRDELAQGVRRIQAAQRAQLPDSTPRLTAGPHCARCPARLSCPAQTALVRQWAGHPETAARDLLAVLTPETAGLAWSRLQAAKASLAEVERQVYAFAAVAPFPLEDGRMFGKHRRRTRDSVDSKAAWRWLVERVGQERAVEAFSLKTSRTALREAVSATAPRGQKRTAGDAAVRELEVAGILAERWVDDVGPYDPKDETTQSAQSALPVAAGDVPPPAAPVLSVVPTQTEET